MTTKDTKGECASCAGGPGNWCYGCKAHICQSCTDVFDHFGDGLHGRGNPAEAVRQLRMIAAQAGRTACVAQPTPNRTCTCDLCKAVRDYPGLWTPQTRRVVEQMQLMVAAGRIKAGTRQIQSIGPEGVGKVVVVVVNGAVFDQVVEPAIIAVLGAAQR